MEAKVKKWVFELFNPPGLTFLWLNQYNKKDNKTLNNQFLMLY